MNRSRLVLAAAIAATAFATPAATSAHTPAASVRCAGGYAVLDASGINFNDSGTNTVKVTVDGHTLYSATFGDTFASTNHVGSGFTDHSITVAFRAWDDPDGAKGYTRTFDLVTGPCKTPPHRVTPPSASISPACGDPRLSWTLHAGSHQHRFRIDGTSFDGGPTTWYSTVAAHGVETSSYHHLLGGSKLTIRSGGRVLASKTVEPAGQYPRCPR